MILRIFVVCLCLLCLPKGVFAQVDINKNVTDYVIPLKNGTKLIEKWHKVLERQPIKEGNAKVNYETLVNVFESVRGIYKSDSYNYQSFWFKPNVNFDYWATPNEFKANNGGDCEDYAISWYYAAREAGFKANQLNIWVGWLPNHDNMQHAVLAVDIDGKQYILDNFNNKIMLASDYMHKEFKLMFRLNENGWSTK